MSKKTQKQKRQPRRRPLVEEIEPRILYSADFAPGLVDAAALTPTAEQRTVDPAGEFIQTSAQDAQARRHELVLVETNTPDYQKLVDDILKQGGDGRDIEVVLLDASKDGIQQITDILAARQDLSAVHLISHGADGQVQLGTTQLDFDTLLKNATQIKGWGKSLSADADILIYGCDVAQQADGKALVDALARLTGADVAASDDLTGAAEQGARLEARVPDGSGGHAPCDERRGAGGMGPHARHPHGDQPQRQRVRLAAECNRSRGEAETPSPSTLRGPSTSPPVSRSAARR